MLRVQRSYPADDAEGSNEVIFYEKEICSTICGTFWYLNPFNWENAICLTSTEEEEGCWVVRCGLGGCHPDPAGVDAEIDLGQGGEPGLMLSSPMAGNGWIRKKQIPRSTGDIWLRWYTKSSYPEAAGCEICVVATQEWLHPSNGWSGPWQTP